MARRRRSGNRLLVPEAEQGMRRFMAEVMRKEGYQVDPNQPDQVKYEVARSMGIPLSQGGNGQLTTESAGKIGGQIGGSMVREMIKLAKQQISNSGR
ncbi:small, acid-soluble spore protein, alpha/beta type [Paenibacillus sp. MBLB4367]|uniref:small, acid-soluble spore protein, alpha/beta type n=1 Tax=Paenibacillus sp. MBLB4367 TaxID=3384767 RepID=UPI003907F679